MTFALARRLGERARSYAEAAAGINRRVWRLGHISAPLEFVPHAFCSWEHRFDDPERAYRTLYCAEHPITCLREVLADLRPNTKARADFEKFQLAQGIAPSDVYRPATEVTVRWREEHALAPAVVDRVAPLADLEDRWLLERLADTHASLLVEHDMPQLDVSQITSKTRPLTQAISRDLFQQGVAGLLFRSNLDGRRCIVLFETRASLHPVGRAIPMTENHPALLQVCAEYRLILQAPVAGDVPPSTRWRP